MSRTRSLTAGTSSAATASARSALAALASVASGGQQLAVAWPARLFDSNRVSRMTPVREHRPVLRVAGTVVLTRRDDVLDVLERNADFRTPYRSRLPGPFVLGMDDGQLPRHRALLRQVLRDDDLGRLRDLAAGTARDRLARATPGRPFDVGAGLVHPVMTEVLDGYLGMTGPTPELLLSWARDIFDDIFLNPLALPGVAARSRAASAALGAHLDAAVAARHAGAAVDDVLGRLLLLRDEQGGRALDDAEVRANLMGVGIGWLWHGAKAAVTAVDELLQRPDQLAAARAAALAVERGGDPEALRDLLVETWRFRPVQPGLPRVCARDTTVATGTAHETAVTKGTRVLAGTHASMWDPGAVPDPHRFDAGREDGQYLVFGHGPHRCLGEAIMSVQLPAMLAPLLARPGLRRVPGRAGRLRRRGAAVDGLLVRLGGEARW